MENMTGIAAVFIAMGIFALFVLGVLMPWFVYRIARHVKAIRADVEAIRHRS